MLELHNDGVDLEIMMCAVAAVGRIGVAAGCASTAPFQIHVCVWSLVTAKGMIATSHNAIRAERETEMYTKRK